MVKSQKLNSAIFFLIAILLTQNIFSQAKIGDTLFTFHSKETGKVGYKNNKKEIIVPPIYNSASYFEGHDYYIVTLGERNTKEEKYACLNNTGKIIIDFKEGYDFIGFHYIKQGFLLVTKKDKKGLVNVRNEVVLPIEYDYIGLFKNGFIIVEKNNKACVLNDSLQKIIDFKYNDIGDFSEIQANGNQIASATLNGKTGCIDTKGNILIPFLYQAIQTFDDGIAKVYNKNKYGYIDLTGKEIVKIIYKDAHYNPDIKCIVANDGKYEYSFNTKGKLLKKQKYIIPTKEIIL